ncbi:ribonuclease HII [Candidatus Profftia tarda]|uniref:Ribonuclease HII n=1 Tax=Candidatus Profftia tarda TaxID=1177216 RepID=A0A8E4EYE7_9ENTR|nr:ribonuclease HII [Candidatus Profftia tarda]CAD6510315.1 Ribonuclease HII [Candidatus Profftia tarda]
MFLNVIYERLIYSSGYRIAGVDEVGYGSLVGPVVTAAVILDPAHPIIGLTDSKKLNEKRRNMIYEKIINQALSWSLGYAEPKEIDELNILCATMLAMKRAISSLSLKPDFVLIDGNRGPSLPMASQTVVKGDLYVEEISAASILAKVTRDREMKNLDAQFPKYEFAKNKGYPTAFHIKCLEKLGVTKQHRYSFRPVKNALHSIMLRSDCVSNN